jgi:two-component system, cell cycle sensor histidine kinase and response regulator CckA
MSDNPNTVDSRNAFLKAVLEATPPGNAAAVYFPPQQYTRLLAGLIHKLNNVITVLSGHTGLLLLQPKLSRTVREPIQQMMEATQLLSRYLDEAVLLSRAPRLELGPVDVVPLLAELPERTGFGVNLTALPASVTVYGDAQQLRACFEQVVQNAREAHAASITCRIEDDGEWLKLSFRDDGKGINADVINRIFEPFFTTKKNDNIGLGLFRIQGYLALTGGGLKVASDGKTYTESSFFLAKTSPP